MNRSRAAGLAAALALAIFPRLRRKKTERAPQDAARPAAGDPGAAPAARIPPAPKSGVSRPKPRRLPYTGNRLKIFIPGRHADGGAAVMGAGARPPAVQPGDQQADPVLAICPSCGARATPEGGLCGRCAVQAHLVETENLLTSLRSKGIDVAAAEISVHQARVALALDTLPDVEELCERAAAAAKRSDLDHDKAGEMLAECERSIATAIESGKETSDSQRSLERATGLYRRGEYAAAMELANGIMDGTRDPGGTAEAPGTSAEASGTKPPVAETPRPSPSTLYGCPEPSTDPGRCAVCGEALEPDWNSCPNCSALIKGGVPARLCRSCGRELLPEWRICPYCDAVLPPEECAEPSRKKWQRGAAAGRAVPQMPPHLREQSLLEQIGSTERLLEEASARGLDVTKARNLLDLASSFVRSRNYDKGERYVRKARNVAETVMAV